MGQLTLVFVEVKTTKLAQVGAVRSSRNHRENSQGGKKAKPHEINFISVLEVPGTHVGKPRFGNESVQRLNERSHLVPHRLGRQEADATLRSYVRHLEDLRLCGPRSFSESSSVLSGLCS